MHTLEGFENFYYLFKPQKIVKLAKFVSHCITTTSSSTTEYILPYNRCWKNMARLLSKKEK